jgi:hypothetical protein
MPFLTLHRIWDTRHLDSIPSEPFPTLTAASDHDRSLYPDTMSEWNEHVYPAMQKKKHAGLLRTESPHEKSCSAAFWDPTGRKVLTTCYDDRIRGTLMSSGVLSELISSASVQRYPRHVQGRCAAGAAVGTGTQNKAQLPDRPLCYHFQGPVVSEPGLCPALHGELEQHVPLQSVLSTLGRSET